MHKGRVVFQRLHQIWLHRLAEQNRHRPIRLDITAIDRTAITAIGNDNVTKTFLQILNVQCKTQDRHDLRGNRDVKACLTRKSVGNAAKACDDVAQRPVVHIDNTTPCNTALVNLQLIAPIDMIVNHRREQIVRRGDGVKITREMQVHLLHRHNLGISTASRTTLHPETGTKRGFTNADHGFLAQSIETVAKTDRGRCLALTGRGGVDCCYENQLAILAIALRLDELGRDFCLVMTEWQQIFFRNTQLFPNLLDRYHICFARNLDV